jgi:FG-GAP repeat
MFKFQLLKVIWENFNTGLMLKNILRSQIMKIQGYKGIFAIVAATFIVAYVFLPSQLPESGDVKKAVGTDAAAIDPTAEQLEQTDWWSKVRNDLSRGEYYATSAKPKALLAAARHGAAGAEAVDLSKASGSDAKVLQAPNREQNLRIYFLNDGAAIVERTAQEPDWVLGIKAGRLGRSGNFAGSARTVKPTADKQRVEYDRGEFVEWFDNRAEGLEHGMTISDRPAGEGPLSVEVSITGLKPRLKEGGQAVELLLPSGEQRMSYEKLIVFDADNKEIPAGFRVAANSIYIEIDDTGARYPIVVDPLLVTPKVGPGFEPDQTSSDWFATGDQNYAHFGISTAGAGDVNGDGFADVIVGAQLYDNGETDEGMVFVYHGSADGLSSTPDWTADRDQAGAYFGFSTAGAGDVNGDGYSDVIVGANYHNTGLQNVGGAFIFFGSADGLSATADWEVEGDQADAELGISVAGAGDVNGDGYADVIVGAYYYDNGETDEGKVFGYYGSATGPTTTADWTVESNQDGARLGRSVAGAGDVNGDGYADVIVGAYRYDHIHIDEGLISIYFGSASGLSTSADWTTYSGQENGKIGFAVAGAGDVNGDGYADVIAGADCYDNGEIEEGRAFVYYGSVTGPGAVTDWYVESNQAGAQLGRSVAGAGDVNGDGYADVIVGAYYYENGEYREGKAFIYPGSATGLSTTAIWSAESDQADAYYGIWVAGAGDVNGDGYADVLVSAEFLDSDNTDNGRVYLYQGSASGLAAVAGWTAESNQAGSSFSYAIAGAGDINGDGYTDIIVGAHNYDNGEGNEGMAFVYFGSATGPTVEAVWTAEGNQASATFGISVAGAGDVNGDGYADIIVGALRCNSGESGAGMAFVYLGSATGPMVEAVWTAEGSHEYANFGNSVAGAGDVNGDGYADIIVGSYNYDNSETSAGMAFVYLGSATGPTVEAVWTAEGYQENAYFGYRVAGAGDVNGDGYADIIVGALRLSNGEIGEGMAFVYFGSATGPTVEAAWTAEGNQASASFGVSVAGAGDVNGDGYADIIVGARDYDNGESNEGMAFVYFGSATGPTVEAVWTAESNQADADFGVSVAGAGDINGDGYADIIVGAKYYDNGEISEGKAFVYFGSAAGPTAEAVWTAEGDCEGAYFGTSVAGAGDVNGDGYADIIVGANNYDHGESNEGMAFVYYGNSGNALAPTFAHQKNEGNTAYIVPGSGLHSDFTIEMVNRSTAGRARVALQYEIKPATVPFDGTGLVTEASFADTTTSTAVYATAVALPQLGGYRWRARLVYDPSTVYNGQIAGRWFTPDWPVSRSADLSLVNSAPVVESALVASVNEGSSSNLVSVLVTISDSDGDEMTAQVDCDNDGIYHEMGEPQLTGLNDGSHLMSCANVDASLWNGPGSQTIGIKVIDSWGDFTTDTDYGITVNNVAPAISGTTDDGPVAEGATVTVTVTASDAFDTLTYDADCNGDADYDDVGDVTGDADGVMSCTTGDDGLLTINVRANDDVTSATSSSTVTVNNSDPTVSPDIGTGPYSIFDTITCEPNYSDIFQDPVSSTTYDWNVDGSWLVLNSATIDGTNFAGNDEVYCRVTVTDGDGGTGGPTNSNHVVVVADSDSDGLDDQWEIDNFGDLVSYAGGDDPDIDGRDNSTEESGGSDPLSFSGPGAPSLNFPVEATEVASLQPTLSVNNATDPAPDDILTYTFEVYSDAALVTMVTNVTDVAEGTTASDWQIDVALTENATYYWRARANDSYTDGPNSDIFSFMVNIANDVPSAPAAASADPLDGGETGDTTPTLTIDPATDADGDPLVYYFEICDVDDCSTVVESSSALSDPTYTAVGDLDDNSWYYWQVWVEDDEGGQSAISGPFSFFVNTANDAPTAPSITSLSDGEEIATTGLTIDLSGATDSDEDPLTYDYQIDTVNTFDSTDLQQVTDSSNSSESFSGLDDNTTYYIRVRAVDDNSVTSGYTSAIAVFVNTANDAPGTPTLQNPSDGQLVVTLTPTLECVNTTDIDGDALGYLFSVYDTYPADVSAITIYESAEIAEQVMSTAHQVPDTELDDDFEYYWSCQAIDEHGLAGDVSATGSFVVNLGNDLPTTPVVILPTEGEIVTDTRQPTLEVENCDDSDGDELTYIFEVYSDQALATPVTGAVDVDEGPQALRLASLRSIGINGLGSTSWQIDVELDEDATYYWRAAAHDGTDRGAYSATASFTINTEADGDDDDDDTVGDDDDDTVGDDDDDDVYPDEITPASSGGGGGGGGCGCSITGDVAPGTVLVNMLLLMLILGLPWLTGYRRKMAR